MRGTDSDGGTVTVTDGETWAQLADRTTGPGTHPAIMAANGAHPESLPSGKVIVPGYDAPADAPTTDADADAGAADTDADDDTAVQTRWTPYPGPS